MGIVIRTLDPAKPPRLSAATKRRLDAMTPEKIQANAESDRDNPPMTAEELAAIRAARKGGRPPLAPERRKRQVTLRLSPEVIDHFKATGPGWQTRIEEALRRAMKRAKDA